MDHCQREPAGVLQGWRIVHRGRVRRSAVDRRAPDPRRQGRAARVHLHGEDHMKRPSTLPPDPATTATLRRRARVTGLLERLEARTLFAVSPGQTLATAAYLGQVGSGTQTFTDYVGAIDPKDYYTFTVASPTDVTLA